MKIKTSELTRRALNWAMAKAEGCSPQIEATVSFPDERHYRIYKDTWYDSNGSRRIVEYSPSTDWSQGGPIIEREKIDLFHQNNGFSGAIKMATAMNPHPTPYFGPTPLIAAMRCFVASKLGDEVDVPEEPLC